MQGRAPARSGVASNEEVFLVLSVSEGSGRARFRVGRGSG